MTRRAATLALLWLLTVPARAGAQAPVSLDGTLDVEVEDYAARAVVRHYVRTDAGRRVEVRYAAAAPRIVGGGKVRVTGRLTSPRTLQAATVEPLAAPAARTLASPYTFGVQTTLVVLVNFLDRLTQPYTPAAAQAVMAQVDAFYRASSYGQASFATTVVGWYTLAVTSTTCDTYTWAGLADAAATAHGVDLSAFSRRVYAFLQTNACGWWGLGSVGGNPSRAWVNGRFALQVVGHELGHNFGDYHSHSASCDVSGCHTSEYGDDRDIMGGTSSGHMNAFQKERLGWLDYGVSPTVQVVTTPGPYHIDPLETVSAGPKALKVLKSTDANGYRTWYYIEARTVTGGTTKPTTTTTTTTSPKPITTTTTAKRTATAKEIVAADTASTTSTTPTLVVDVHLGSESNANSSSERDLLPTTTSYDTSLDVGQSFSDPAIRLTVTTISSDATGAYIQVSF